MVAALGAEGKGDSGDGPALKGGGTLEDQIVAANPAMEAYGNARPFVTITRLVLASLFEFISTRAVHLPLVTLILICLRNHVLPSN